jgi:hypothetical protein
LALVGKFQPSSIGRFQWLVLCPFEAYGTQKNPIMVMIVRIFCVSFARAIKKYPIFRSITKANMCLEKSCQLMESDALLDSMLY